MNAACSILLSGWLVSLLHRMVCYYAANFICLHRKYVRFDSILKSVLHAEYIILIRFIINCHSSESVYPELMTFSTSTVSHLSLQVMREREASNEVIVDQDATIKKFRELVQKQQEQNLDLRHALEKETNKPIGTPSEIIDFKVTP